MPLIEISLVLVGKALLGCLAAGAVVGIVVALLTWDRLFNWFRGKSSLVHSNRHNVAVMVKEAQRNGKVSVVTGVFNQATNEVLSHECYQADQLDGQTKKFFGGNNVVIVT